MNLWREGVAPSWRVGGWWGRSYLSSGVMGTGLSAMYLVEKLEEKRKE